MSVTVSMFMPVLAMLAVMCVVVIAGVLMPMCAPRLGRFAVSVPASAGVGMVAAVSQARQQMQPLTEQGQGCEPAEQRPAGNPAACRLPAFRVVDQRFH